MSVQRNGSGNDDPASALPLRPSTELPAEAAPPRHARSTAARAGRQSTAEETTTVLPADVAADGPPSTDDLTTTVLSTAAAPVTPPRARPAAAGRARGIDQAGATPVAEAIPTPRPPTDAETVVLPGFITGLRSALEPDPAEPAGAGATGVAEPAGPAHRDPGLGRTEKGMLIFVAGLLTLGTLAVVAMMGFGLPAAAPRPKASRSAPGVPVAPSPSPALSVSVSPSPVPASATASTTARSTPRRTPSSPAKPVSLGSLGLSELAGYCAAYPPGGYTLRPPGTPVNRVAASDAWNCVQKETRRSFDIVPTAACRWRFNDSGAYSPARNPADPLPWKCYT